MLESPGSGWAGYKNMENMFYLTQTSVNNNNKLSANRQDQDQCDTANTFSWKQNAVQMTFSINIMRKC